jgi:hypothetical protein
MACCHGWSASIPEFSYSALELVKLTALIQWIGGRAEVEKPTALALTYQVMTSVRAFLGVSVKLHSSSAERAWLKFHRMLLLMR